MDQLQAFCTIITADYYPKALALFQSLKEFNELATLHVLVSDNKIVPEKAATTGLTFTPVKSLSQYPLVDSLYKKYAHTSSDEFRWSLKPVFSSYLLRNGYEKVIYVDCDMFFVNDYHFLFTELDHHDVLLTPHWNNTNPLIDKQSFLSNFTSGMFSAGFFAANQNALTALDWWANACHFMMGPNIELGIHDDQRYLDIFPVLFENTEILRHRGCNIGSWNYGQSKRTLINGQLMINEKYPVIFIHFDEMLITTILKGHDQLLAPYLKKYQQAFQLSEHKLSDFIPKLDSHINAGFLLKLKWKLRLRTRLKKILYKLAESI